MTAEGVRSLAVSGESKRGRMSSARTSTATRLAASVVAISLLSLVAATIVGVTTGEELSDDLNDERLRATVESAAWDVAAELRGFERTTRGLAASLQAALAVEQFDDAFTELTSSVDGADYSEEFEELLTVYREDYIDPLRASGRDVQLRDIAGVSPVAGYLQYEYAVDLGSIARPSTIDDADDGSEWTAIHRRVHPVYRDVTTRLDLVDLYLVSPSGRVLYSVNKRPDLGTNLRTGPFSGSVLANTYRRVVDNPDEPVVTSDLRFYDAVPDDAIGVVGSPIIDDDLVGVLLISYRASTLTELVTADQSWEAAGLPETGDVYVAGGVDGTTRTDPRGFLETPSEYLEEAEAAGRLTSDERTRIEALGTTVLTQSVVDETVDAGLKGNTATRETTNVTGSSVLSVTVPVATESVSWYVIAEVDAEAAGRGLDDFQELLIVGAAIFVVVLAFFAVAWANGIIRPVRYISDRISRHGRSEGDIEVPPQTPVEIQQLALQLARMKHTLVAQHEEIAVARAERLGLLRSMLPASVADRVAAGDVRSLEQAPAASVVVIVVLGLADLVRDGSDTGDRELVDHLLTELDDLAAVHGLDRIKVVGDAYYGACGHDRPYIDHAPRSVAFALDALDAIAELDTDAPLSLAIGIHSGPVTTGMAGGASLVYDVWGLTVGTAHVLARQARGGQVRVTEASRSLLPDSYATEPIDVDGEFVVTRSEEVTA